MSPLGRLDGRLPHPLMDTDALSRSTSAESDKPQRKRNSSMDTNITEPSSSPSPPPSPVQQQGSYHTRRNSFPLFSLLLRRNSRVLSSPYAGPRPLGRDGNPLKSCLSKTQRTSDVRKVSFSHVSIREYSRVVGDNPSVCCGPPLSLGWKFNKRGRTDIDTFEAIKTQTSLCNGRQCQRLSPNEREQLLTDIGGANHSQIMKGSMQANYDNKLRWQSLNALGGENHYKSIGPRERVLIMKESARRKFDRACKGTSTFQEQQELWDKAREATLLKLKRQVTV